jgi:hypothetical protein
LEKIRERLQNSILQVNHVYLKILNYILVKRSLQHQITQQVVVQIQRNLPLVHKMAFSFELNENIEPSKFVIELLDIHVQFKDQKNPSASTRK